MKLWQCSICEKVGFWGPNWGHYSNLLLDDEAPGSAIVVCSDDCRAKAESRLNDGSIALPKIKINGYNVRIAKKHVGYLEQPSQSALINQWNKMHPNDAICTPSLDVSDPAPPR